jgi:hypothetical protein
MANVLDVVLETAKTLSPAPTRKITEASKAQPEAETKQEEVEAATIQAETCNTLNLGVDFFLLFTHQIQVLLSFLFPFRSSVLNFKAV